jgi:hypothetical protein
MLLTSGGFVSYKCFIHEVHELMLRFTLPGSLSEHAFRRQFEDGPDSDYRFTYSAQHNVI